MSRPPVSPDVQPAPGPPTARRGPVRPLTGALACMATIAAGAALAQTYNPENLPAPQVRQVSEICRTVLGLPPDERAFSSCIESLSRSAVELDRDSAMQDARRTCMAKGLRPGDPALDECEVDATKDNGAPVAPAGHAPPLAPPAKAYFSLSWREAHQRQRMACAALGYDPAGAGFDNCVASLQASLLRAEHPST